MPPFPRGAAGATLAGAAGAALAGAVGLALLSNRGVRELIKYGLFGGKYARGDILHNLVQKVITWLPPQSRVCLHWRQQTNLPMLAAGYELGVFEILLDGPLEFEELLARVQARSSANAKADRRCFGGLVRAMVAAGWLAVDKRRRTLRSVFSEDELKESRVPVMMAHTVLQRQMYFLAEAVRTGRAAGLSNVLGDYDSLYAAREIPEVAANWEPWMESQRRRGWDTRVLGLDISGQFDLSLAAVKKLPSFAGLSPKPKVLDWCGSHGYNSIRASRNQLRGATFTVLDLPCVCEVGRMRVAEQGMADVVSFLPTDLVDPLFALPEGEKFDLVVMFHTVREWSMVDVRRFLKEVSKALKPGGAVFINMCVERSEYDFVHEPRWSSYGAMAPLYQWNGDAVQALYFMACASHATNTHSHAEMRSALEDTGFGEFATTGPSEFHPVVAVKTAR